MGIEALVADARRGSDGAFRELVDRTHGRIYRWALAQTGDPDDADDVAQGVLVKLLTRLSTYRGDARFSTWLYRVTRNASIEHLRKGRRRLAAEQRHVAQERLEATGPSVAERIEQSEQMEEIVAAFQRLPAGQRTVFDLVDLQGYAPKDVARMLDIHPVTVRAHLFKARRAIRSEVVDPRRRDGVQ